MKKENSLHAQNLPNSFSFIQEQTPSNKGNQTSLQDYFHDLLSLQYQVNQALIINGILTDQFLRQNDESVGKNSSSEGSTLVSGKQKIGQQKSEKRPPDVKVIEKRKKRASSARHKELSSSSQYEPSEDQQVFVQYKLSQSKNVPKNYGKGILNFIKKNQPFITKVVKKFNLDHHKFSLFLAKFKNNINTIAQLRSLWINENRNEFAPALRVISFEYLRKHSLSHIFNSRVENYGKHVKYRQKILKAIEKPEEFTQMKDF